MKYFHISSFILLVCLLAVLPGLASCVKVAAPQGNQLAIQSLKPVQNQTSPGGTVAIESAVANPDNANLIYKWSSSGGGFGGSGANNIWQAPSQPGTYEITLTVEDGKGGMAQSKTTITVSNNRPPAIVSLTADPKNVMPGGNTLINCVANDPDGDIIRYSWNASDGSVTGSGSKVTWVAPSKSGDFAITCVVSDGNGGEAKQSVTVSVSPSGSNITINLIRQESGTVASTGDKDTSRYRAGDDAKNVTYRAFFSYDIFSLNKTNVRQAKLKFGPANISGDPFGSLTGLRLWKVGYGGGLPDYNITGDNFFFAGGLLTSSPSEIDVTPEITSLAAAGASRFQFETLFYKATNNNNAVDAIEWPDVRLEIVFNP
jgi:hypothetical protein